MAAKDNNKEKEAALPEGQAEKPKKKSRAKKIVIILAILLMLAALGIGAYWWFYIRTPGGESAGTEVPVITTDSASQPQTGQNGQDSLNSARIERQSELPRSTGMVLPLPSITVNLAGDSGRRYLKLGMEVEVNADVSAELKAQEARIKDAIIMMMAGKTYGDIASPDGKVLLKADIAARLNQILGAQRVVRVYFTDFVVE